MLFNSLEFLLFFPAVTLLYFFMSHKYRWVWLLITSYYFYMSWDARYALLIATSTLITYISGILIGYSNTLSNQEKASRQKRLWVALSFISNLALLIFFKYFYFILDNLNGILQLAHINKLSPQLDIVLPVGISFYTFQALSYTMDVYRGEIVPEKSLGKYALFVSFFPQLVAGPIERSKNLIAQIHEEHHFDFDRMVSGLLLMGWGFFQKLIVADRVAIVVNTVFNDHLNYKGIQIIIAVLFFTIQIYCDFAGYSNIAIGAAEIMGFRLMINFRQPYFSMSIKEFWRRWHISLSTWFKDYLYFPLGGNRRGIVRTYINTMVVFLVSGIWHGANWTFILWGGLHGIYQLIGGATERFRRYLKQKIGVRIDGQFNKFLQISITFLLTSFAWIFFRANTISDAFGIIANMIIGFNYYALFDGSVFKMGLDKVDISISLLAIAILFIGDFMQKRFSVREELKSKNIVFRWAVSYILIIALVIFGVYGPGYDASQFIYFQF